MRLFAGLLFWGIGVLVYGFSLVIAGRKPLPTDLDAIRRGWTMSYRRSVPYVLSAGALGALAGSIGVVTQAAFATPAPRYFAVTGGYGAVVAAVGIGLGVLARMRSAPEHARRSKLLRAAGRWTRRVGVLAALAGTLGRIVVGHW